MLDAFVFKILLMHSIVVGREGHVDSYELRSDHLKIARKNVELWKQSWNVNHSQTWPDNIYFFHQNIMKAPPLLTDEYDAVNISYNIVLLVHKCVFPMLHYACLIVVRML